MLKLAQIGRVYLPRLISPTTSSFLTSTPMVSTTCVAPFCVTSVDYAKKSRKRFKTQPKVEIVEMDDGDDDDVDDTIDEKTALKAKGILHRGVGEAEEIVDDGLPQDYKHKSLKLASRRIDTLLNRTSGRGSSDVEKMILSGCVKINDQIEKKKAHNISKGDEIDVWLEALPENPLLANVHRIKILDYVLKQSGYDIECQIWAKMLVENWRHDGTATSNE